MTVVKTVTSELAGMSTAQRSGDITPAYARAMLSTL